MMFPETTRSSPYFLTPRRRPSESRPLRDEPPAFLCAITRVLELGSDLLARGRFGQGRLGCRLRATGRGSSLGDRRAVQRDRPDPHDREVLPVTTLAARILAAALLEGDDLRAARLLDDLAHDARARNRRGTHLDAAFA